MPILYGMKIKCQSNTNITNQDSPLPHHVSYTTTTVKQYKITLNPIARKIAGICNVALVTFPIQLVPKRLETQNLQVHDSQ